MTIYLPTSRNYYPKGTPVKICFEGRITRGALEEHDSDKRIVGVRTGVRKVEWAHESLVTLDNK